MVGALVGANELKFLLACSQWLAAKSVTNNLLADWIMSAKSCMYHKSANGSEFSYLVRDWLHYIGYSHTNECSLLAGIDRQLRANLTCELRSACVAFAKGYIYLYENSLYNEVNPPSIGKFRSIRTFLWESHTRFCWQIINAILNIVLW